jgi:hypothetical protein
MEAISSFTSSTSKNQARLKLIESVQGPIREMKNEKSGRNSRDTLFELSMATVLRRCGISGVTRHQLNFSAFFAQKSVASP